MIPYEIDQKQKQQQQQSCSDRYLLGITEGSRGLPLQIKLMHNLEYINGYILGLGQWATELECREQENHANSVFEF